MNKKYLYAVVLGLVVNATAASAVSVYDINYDMDTEIVTIGGSSSPNKKITLEILKGGVESEDLKTAATEDITDYIYRVDQTMSDETGSFLFSFGMPSSQEEYITRVNVDGVQEGLLVCVNLADYQLALDAVNGAADKEAMLVAINEKGKLLGMTNGYFSKLDNNQQLKIAQDILNLRNTKIGQVFADETEFLGVYNEGTAVEALKRSVADPTIDAVKLAEENESIFKLKELKEYSAYQGFDDAQKKGVMAAVASSGEINSVSSIRTAFAEKAALAAIDHISGYDKLYDTLVLNNDIYGIDFTVYNTLSAFNQTRVLQMIAGNTYVTPEALRTAFAAAVTSMAVAAGGSNGGGGGGGSSSGGGVMMSPSAASNGVSDNAKPFSDLANYAWAEESILALYEKNVVSGRGNREFCPGDYVKREEFVKMLVCAINEQGNKTTGMFTDVIDTAWYAPFVNRSAELGLVSGVGEGVFGIGTNITRQDIAAILYRASQMLGIELPAVRTVLLNDADSIGGYAKAAVETLSNAGIINGTEDGGFAPQRFATRAETARLIYEFLKYCK